VGESPAGQDASPGGRVPGEPFLRVQGLRSTGGRRALNGLDLTLNRGEIYGIAGVGGNGQSELANALMGIPEAVSGRMEIVGEGDLADFDAARRRALGIAAIPADRYGAALAGPLSIADNFALGDIHSGRYGPFWYLNTRAIEADAAEAVRQFDVQGVRSLKQKAALLSGGNAQKLVIAREFSHPPQLVLAHSPSRGLDVKATEAVRERLRAARDNGAAVLLISEDLDEVMAMADRIGVMSAGRIVAEFSQPADRQAIGQAMVNHV
jgi:simple sugar transport system ATP-binding protein